MRRAYGVRLRMLHERTAIWGESKNLDAEMFCLLGTTGKGPKGKFNDPQQSVVNILGYKMNHGMTFDEALVEAEKLIYGPQGKKE